MFNFVNRLFGRHKNQLTVRFHTDANNMAEHGTFYADHKGKNLSNYPVRFAFEGISTPPRLDRDLFNHVMDKAEAEGYVVLGLRSYFGMVQNTGTKVSTEVVREKITATPNKRALDLHYATERARTSGKSQIIHNGQLLVTPEGTTMSAPPHSMYVKLPSGEISVLTEAHGIPPAPVATDDVLDMSGMLGSPDSVPYPGSRGMPYNQFKATAPN